MKATLACVVVCLANAQPNLAASFQGLGGLLGPNGNSAAISVSADGLVVVGDSPSERSQEFDNDYWEAFRWRSETGMVGLGFIDGFTTGVKQQSSGIDLSADGSVVVGQATDSESVYGIYRWTTADGMSQLDIPHTAPRGLSVVGTSAMGDVVAGTLSNDENSWRVYRWSEADGLQVLPHISGAPAGSLASGISADGAVIVGNDQLHEEPFYWTAATGTVALPVPPNMLRTMVHVISGDGSTLVGDSNSLTESQGLVWTIGGGYFELPDLGAIGISPQALSADGSVIVGSLHFDDERGSQPFIWDEEHGMRILHEALTAAGIDLAGWELRDVADISADGLTIVGNGRSPTGDFRGWIATVPEPSSIVLSMVAAVGFTVAVRRRTTGRQPGSVQERVKLT